MGADAMKLPASSAHITVLLERESAIVLILDLFWFPDPVGPDPRMSCSTKANMPPKTNTEFDKTDIFFDKKTWLIYRPAQ
jgi:hypothetical protein